jgi:hypothetical protein
MMWPSLTPVPRHGRGGGQPPRGRLLVLAAVRREAAELVRERVRGKGRAVPELLRQSSSPTGPAASAAI